MAQGKEKKKESHRRNYFDFQQQQHVVTKTTTSTKIRPFILVRRCRFAIILLLALVGMLLIYDLSLGSMLRSSSSPRPNLFSIEEKTTTTMLRPPKKNHQRIIAAVTTSSSTGTGDHHAVAKKNPPRYNNTEQNLKKFVRWISSFGFTSKKREKLQCAEDYRFEQGGQHSTIAAQNNDIKNSTSVLHDSRFRNLRIAFLGDSITRYTYLNLVYYLRYGVWMPNSNISCAGRMVEQKKFPSWMSFYNYTNKALRPHESCNCFRVNRPNVTREEQVREKSLYENRYYRDYDRNVHVTFIQKFGYHDAWGHWNASEMHQGSRKHSDGDDPLFGATEPAPAVWSYGWADTIRHHLGEMDPKPDYVVMNSGLWGEGGLWLEGVRRNISAALDETGIVGIYKTTTAWKAHRSAKIFPHEIKMCELLRHCLNLSYTHQYGGNDDYWDSRHFRAHVYNRMNAELLELIDGIENNRSSTQVV